MKIVGVVGAGVMGCGVAQNLAESGFDVCLVDLTEDILDRSRQDIRNALRLQRLLRGAAAGDATERIEFTTRYEALGRADYVIENVVEKWPVKQEVYRLLEQHCRPECVFAANTSAIPITRIGAATRRPGQVVGIHFMNPVPLKKCVEVIRGVHTTSETIETTRELLARMGKDLVLVNDSPGFVSNRVLMLTINEAINLVHERVSTPEDIDRVFRECFGHAMGPLATADLIGLDTILYSVEVLYDAFADSRFRPSPLLKQLVDAGYHGRKTGRGIFEYPTV